MKKAVLTVRGNTISKILFLKEDYISLTDIARIKNPAEPKDVVKNWMRSRSTIEFLGIWESLNNENFKGVEFDSLLIELKLYLKTLGWNYILNSLKKN